jgi:hypothetical protein
VISAPFKPRTAIYRTCRLLGVLINPGSSPDLPPGAVSRALYGISVRVQYFKSGETAELESVLQDSNACVIVLTEQALLELKPSNYSSVAVLYMLLPPAAGVDILVKEFNKTTLLEVSEPRIEPSLLQAGSLAFKSVVRVEASTEHRKDSTLLPRPQQSSRKQLEIPAEFQTRAAPFSRLFLSP